MGRKFKLNFLTRKQKKTFADVLLVGQGTLSLESQAGHFQHLLKESRRALPTVAYDAFRTANDSISSLEDDGFHTDPHTESDSDPGKDSNDDYENVVYKRYPAIDAKARGKFRHEDRDVSTDPEPYAVFVRISKKSPSLNSSRRDGTPVGTPESLRKIFLPPLDDTFPTSDYENCSSIGNSQHYYDSISDNSSSFGESEYSSGDSLLNSPKQTKSVMRIKSMRCDTTSSNEGDFDDDIAMETNEKDSIYINSNKNHESEEKTVNSDASSNSLLQLAMLDEKTMSQQCEDISHNRDPTFAVGQYVDFLTKFASGEHSNEDKVSSAPAKMQLKDGISPMSFLLRKLKLDLKMSHDSFVAEFLDNKGMTLLVNLLKEIQHGQNNEVTIRRTQLDQHKRSLTDEHDCLLSIKFALRVEGAMHYLFEIDNGLETVALCLMSNLNKARVTGIEILTTLVNAPDGFNRILDAFSYIRLKFGECVRFKLLVSMLSSKGAVYVSFQRACMKMFNTILNAAYSPNLRVYLQQELELAGLDLDQLDKNAKGDGLEYDELCKELNEWRYRYVNVQSLIDDYVSTQNRSAMLRDEVDLQQDRVKMLEKGRLDLEKQINQITEDCEAYKDRAFNLQNTVDTYKRLYKDEIEDDDDQNDVPADYEVPEPTEITPLVETRRSSCSSLASTLSIPAPPPPPSSPSSDPSGRASIMKPRVSLPMLNWVPLHNVENTIFQALDEDSIFKEVDFEDFENKFQLTRHQENKLIDITAKTVARSESKIRFIASNRAKNLVIMQRRVGFRARDIRDFINNLDIENIPGEYAELLLKFIPTKDEIKQVTLHACNYGKLDEAEQFMYQMSQVERIEAKLSLMSFMGQFQELIDNVNPQIDQIYEASISLANNNNVKKLLEVILAFGNYMNSSRRGFTPGFKLESLSKLSDVRSKDRSLTLLQYLVNVVETRYPSIANWWSELAITVSKSASYQSITTDIHTLRNGVELVKVEKEKYNEHENPRIESFYVTSSGQVHKTLEKYKKMEEAYKDVCSRFGENYKQCEPGVFFNYFVNFADAYWKSMCEQNEQTKSPNESPVTSPLHHKRLPIGYGIRSKPPSPYLSPVIIHKKMTTPSDDSIETQSNNSIAIPAEGSKDRYPKFCNRDMEVLETMESNHAVSMSNWVLQEVTQREAQYISRVSRSPCRLTAVNKQNWYCRGNLKLPNGNDAILRNLNCDVMDTQRDILPQHSTLRSCPASNMNMVICYDDVSDQNTFVANPSFLYGKKVLCSNGNEYPDIPSPDYSVSDSSATDRTSSHSSSSSLSNGSDISKILREFEGNLKPFDDSVSLDQMISTGVTHF